MAMTWSLWSSSLPEHCEPANDFLLRFSSTFHVCVPSELAFISNTLGVLSIAAWLSAQLPQIWKNYNLKSTSGLSLYFLIEWCLGDLGNLLGAIFTHQAPWQVTIGGYYVFVDFCLVLQWLWYERLKHGRPLLSVRRTKDPALPRNDDMLEVSATETQSTQSEPQSITSTRSDPRPIFRTPTFERATAGDGEKDSTPRGTKVYRLASSSQFPAPSPKTVLLIACMIAVAQASPTTAPLVTSMHSDEHLHLQSSTPLERAGTVLSWMSTALYIGSRFPQIFKNWSRKSTAGLSAHLFIAAFCGNLLYSAAIVTNPNAWNDFGPYGGGGWAGPDGNDHKDWFAAALPFFLGAAGVLVLDATVGMQFVLYRDISSKVIVVQDSNGKQWRWRRVSGWMRGWMPSVKDDEPDDSQRALLQNRTTAEGYGTLR